MKLSIKKKITFDLTLDSSEAIMFTQGGKHKINLKTDDDYHNYNLNDYDEVEFSVQLARNEQGRFDFITGEAAKHREIYDNESKSV